MEFTSYDHFWDREKLIAIIVYTVKLGYKEHA